MSLIYEPTGRARECMEKNSMTTFSDCELCNGGEYREYIVHKDRVMAYIAKDCPLCAMRSRLEQAQDELTETKSKLSDALRSTSEWRHYAAKYSVEVDSQTKRADKYEVECKMLRERIDRIEDEVEDFYHIVDCVINNPIDEMNKADEEKKASGK